MVDNVIPSIKQQILTGQLQKNFQLISENIKKKSIPSLYDPSLLPMEYSDLFSFYLYLIKSFSDLEAFQKLIEYLEWRERFNETTSPLGLDHLLGCNVNTIFKHMPECHYGYDKNRRPVVYYLFGKYDLNETLKILTRKQIFDYHLWQNDAINELCYHKTLESGTMISSSTLVMDVSDMTSANTSPEFLHILNRRAEVNGRYFPYLFDRILIINAISTDTKMIRTLKEFCSLYSPRANVYVTGPERNPSDVLSKYIDIDQLPSEYGGLKGSIMNITHPYYDAITFRRTGGGALPYRKGGVAYTPSPGTISQIDRKFEKRTSYTTTTIGTSPYDVEDEEFRAHFSTSASLGGTMDGGNDERTFSTTSSRYLYPNTRYNNRSISVASAHGLGSLVNKTEFLLSNVSMNPMARQTLIIFLELFTGSSLPYPSLLFDNMTYPQHHQTAQQVDATVSNASTSPYSSYTGKSIDTSVTFQSNNTSNQPFSRFGAHNFPSQRPTASNSSMQSQSNPMPSSSMAFGPLHSPPILSVSMTVKPSVLSLSVDTVLYTSVGNGLGDNTDIFCLRTKTGVISFQAAVPHTIPNSNDPSNLPIPYTTKKLSANRYTGSLVVSNGRIYCLTRGASMSGWLQKWPMRSQSAGSYTHRYFILEDNELKYWKIDPSNGKGLPGNRASVSSTTPQSPPPDSHPKGGITLTPNTIIKRSKTLFGSSIIEIKSEYDSITLCAYNSSDDSAWFSELYHALERVKKVYRDENSNGQSHTPPPPPCLFAYSYPEQPFPEIVWRQQDPLCVAIDADVIDTSSCDDYYRYRTSIISPPLTITSEMHRKSAAQTNLSIHSSDSSPLIMMENNLDYVVLCRVNTGLSSLHSVQIGSYEHVPLRLENNDLDIGVKLLSVKLCGDCLIVSGSNGFVGSGRISQFCPDSYHHPSTPTSNSSVLDLKRIYIRRFLNNFHGEDSVIQCLATPRYHLHTENNATGPFNYLETSVSILASGDDLGGLCVWKRDKGATGPTYLLPSKAAGQQSTNASATTTVRYGYTWTCIHHAKVGHRITSLSFSNDGNYLAVTTLERALIFDLTILLSSDTITPLQTQSNTLTPPLPLNARGQVNPYPLPTHYIPSRDIRTYVLDDSVGHTSEVSFSVDLSSNGFVKIWKLKQGTDVGGHGPNQSMDEGQHHRSESDRSGIAPDHLSYTEIPLSYFLNKQEPYLPLHQLFTQKEALAPSAEKGQVVATLDSSTTSAADNQNIRFTVGHSSEIQSVVLPSQSATDPPATLFGADSFGNMVQCEQSSHREGSTVSEPINGSVESEEKLANLPGAGAITQPLSSSLLMTSRSFLSKQRETGWMIDPFCYADVCVIDPLRMHLRDWWCDYSSRYLLLGHLRIASLTNFEPISLSSHSSLSKGNPLRDDHSMNSASPISTSSLSGSARTGPASGLDRKSTSMFWSTLTSSLGRRVIARYYIPLMYYEKKKQNLDIKPDCLKFILYISRCLYETLGEEYLNAVLVSWKAMIQNELRSILEKYSSTWFKDLTFIHLEILRRFELSPNLALNCLDELIQMTCRGASQLSADIDFSPGIPFSTTSATAASALDASPPLIELQNVINMLVTLRTTLCMICDEYGILHLVPSYLQRYLAIGIVPLQTDSSSKLKSSQKSSSSVYSIDPNSYGMPTQSWEDENPIQLLHSLIIEPLSYLERTEPFAVALTIVGLQGVPSYIYNNIMGLGGMSGGEGSTTGNMTETDAGGPGGNEKTSAEKLLLSLQRERKIQSSSGADTSNQEKGIEALISLMAKIMPPWIRFILTSDTDKVIL